MSPRKTVFLAVAALGLLLYLWPAFRAPVVLWSDSVVDLDWARAGAGIVGPVPTPKAGQVPLHPAKPAYLLFLRAGLTLAPPGYEGRTIVILQSIFLWLSIVGTSWLVLRHRGWVGILVLVVLLGFLRLRDTASAVMPEALCAALLIPITAWIVLPPRSRAGRVGLGLAVALLFWVRPNAGGIALALAVAAPGLRRRGRDALPILTGFALLFLPVWFLTRPEAGGSLRGLSFPILEASTDYYWMRPGSMDVGSREELQRRDLARAAANWKGFLRERGPDGRRQLVFRLFRGLFATEFFDTRWSRLYGSADIGSRLLTPFFTIGATGAILVSVVGGGAIPAAGMVLLLLLVGQDLLVGPNPRFVLPLLPVLYVLGVLSLAKISPRRWIALVAVFALLVVFVATYPFLAEWEWGRIEDAGVTIRQAIPKGKLPQAVPVTLHIRIVSPIVPSAAHFELRGPRDQVLYSTVDEANRNQPAIRVTLPQSILDENQKGPVDLHVVSIGSYGPLQYLLFPVIPWPWRKSAERLHASELSPSTGIRAGSLDWWAHAGRD